MIETLEDRSERGSTLITRQMPVKGWHGLIGEPTIADSICDRIIHTSHVVELQGPSLRETRAKVPQRRHERQRRRTARPAAGRPLPGYPL